MNFLVSFFFRKTYNINTKYFRHLNNAFTECEHKLLS